MKLCRDVVDRIEKVLRMFLICEISFIAPDTCVSMTIKSHVVQFPHPEKAGRLMLHGEVWWTAGTIKHNPE